MIILFLNTISIWCFYDSGGAYTPWGKFKPLFIHCTISTVVCVSEVLASCAYRGALTWKGGAGMSGGQNLFSCLSRSLNPQL